MILVRPERYVTIRSWQFSTALMVPTEMVYLQWAHTKREVKIVALLGAQLRTHLANMGPTRGTMRH